MPDIGSPLFAHRMNKAIQESVLSKVGNNAFVERYMGEVTGITASTNTMSVKLLGSGTASAGFKVGPGIHPVIGSQVIVCIHGQDRWIDRVLGGSSYQKVKLWNDSQYGLEFGSGSAAPDTNLYRSAADTLKTDDNLHVGASIRVATAGGDDGVQIGDDAIIYDGDVANQFGIKGISDATAGGMFFGSAKDTNLYRGGANLLKTDDSLHASGHTLSTINITPSATTCTVAQTYYAVGSTPAELSFTPTYVGQRWLIILHNNYLYWNAAGAMTANLRLVDSSNVTVVDGAVVSRHEDPSGVYRTNHGMYIWEADAVAVRKAKLYAQHTAAGTILTWANVRIQAYPLP